MAKVFKLFLVLCSIIGLSLALTEADEAFLNSDIIPQICATLTADVDNDVVLISTTVESKNNTESDNPIKPGVQYTSISKKLLLFLCAVAAARSSISAAGVPSAPIPYGSYAASPYAAKAYASPNFASYPSPSYASYITPNYPSYPYRAPAYTSYASPGYQPYPGPAFTGSVVANNYGPALSSVSSYSNLNAPLPYPNPNAPPPYTNTIPTSVPNYSASRYLNYAHGGSINPYASFSQTPFSSPSLSYSSPSPSYSSPSPSYSSSSPVTAYNTQGSVTAYSTSPPLNTGLALSSAPTASYVSYNGIPTKYGW